MSTSLTDNITGFALGTDYSDIPDEVKAVAKKAILDCLGCILGGSSEPPARIAGDVARQAAGVPEAAIIGTGSRTSAEMAGLVNGLAAHVLDYDDIAATRGGFNFHPSVCVVPALLASGEKVQASGRDILVAYVIGVETELKLGSIIGREANEIGWHPTPVLGTIGAALACARLLGLNPVQTGWALGIAASLASGLVLNFGTMTKSLHAGNAARNGILAATLAGEGFTGNPDILEARRGFCSVFGAGKLPPPGGELGWGKSWSLLFPGIAFKPYPSCWATQSGIEAALSIRNRHVIKSEMVAAIDCKGTAHQYQMLQYHQPRTPLEAKFSLEYCVASALLFGELRLEHFTETRVLSPAVQSLLDKTKFTVFPPGAEAGRLDTQVKVRLQDGTEYTGRASIPKGDPENPVGDELLSAKFRDCAGSVLAPQIMDKVIDTVYRLDSLESITELISLLAPVRDTRK